MRYQAPGRGGEGGGQGGAGGPGGAAMLGRLFQGKGRAAGGSAGGSSEGAMEGFGSAPQTSGVRSPPPPPPPPPRSDTGSRCGSRALLSFRLGPAGSISSFSPSPGADGGRGCPPGGVGEGGRGRGARRLHITTGGRSRGPVAARRRSLCAVRARAGEGRADNLNYSCFPRHRSKLRSSRQKLN